MERVVEEKQEASNKEWRERDTQAFNLFLRENEFLTIALKEDLPQLMKTQRQMLW